MRADARTALLVVGVAVSPLVGCSPELRLSREGLSESERVRTVAVGTGYETQVDASSYNEWTLFSFVSRSEAPGEVHLAEPFVPADAGSDAFGDLGVDTNEIAPSGAGGIPADAAMGDEESIDAGALSTWDLAFQRFHVLANGGVSGAGSVMVLALPEQAFEALEEAPATGYLADQPDSGDDDERADTAFAPPEGEGWYSYDSSDNSLSPNDITYVVRAPHGHYKLRFLGYYSSAGSSGYPSFQWAPLEAESRSPKRSGPGNGEEPRSTPQH